MAEFEIYKDAKFEFCWRFKANNRRTLAESAEWDTNSANCEHAIFLIKQQVAIARIRNDFNSEQIQKETPP